MTSSTSPAGSDRLAPPEAATPASPAWIATGAAVMGVLIGGAAVWLGLYQREVNRGAATGVDTAPAASLASLSAADAEAGEAAVDPGDEASPLVAAVARTRDTVVNLETPRGLGAGVIVDPRGIVVTNFHVIADALAEPRTGLFGAAAPRDAPRVTARFGNDRKVPAEVLVADPGEDLAVLRLRPADSGERFAAAELGSSASLAVGQEVFAVGNPFGLQHTVTRGIVSAVDRVGILDDRQPVIQLDASINLGNSGGPLFDLQGRLVGIVAARRQQAQGIAFALPINHVRGFLRAAADPDAARSGTIGVGLELAAELPAPAVELGYRAGLVVDNVYPEGPAARAGLQPGDVLVAVRGKRLDGLPDPSPGQLALHLQSTVRTMFPGETLALTVVREGAREELEVEVASASERDQVFIDAEELLGLELDREAEAPTVVGIHPASALQRYASVLRGTQVVRLMREPVDDLEGLGERLTNLRRLVRQQGSMPTVLVGFRDPEGREAEVPVRVAGVRR